jgi:hypothetical protein
MTTEIATGRKKISLETIKTQTTEVFIETEGGSITVTHWSNCEGVNIMMVNQDLTPRFAAALTWEDVDALMVSLAASRL